MTLDKSHAALVAARFGPRAAAYVASAVHARGADVVSPGGACALLDTYLQTVELLRDPSHVRDYSTGEWRRSLTDAGFAPNVVTKARLRIEFFSWIERIATPDIHIQAIRSLQANMAADVIDYFAIEPDGSFSVDTMMLEAS